MKSNPKPINQRGLCGTVRTPLRIATMALKMACAIACLLAWDGPPAMANGTENASRNASSERAPDETKPAAPPADAKKTAILVPRLGLMMQPIPAGTFTMGSPKEEAGRDDDERQHQVSITKPFWLAASPVTWAQWKKVMGTTPKEQLRAAWNSDLECWDDGDGKLVTMKKYFDVKKLEISEWEKGLSENQDDDFPMIWVSWYEAMEFCRELTETERAAGRLPSGYEYTLPTEAQWEYACRAGTSGPYGRNGNLDEMGWYDKNSGGNLHSVLKKKPNAWGLYDMHGNVWEWCLDWYGEYPEGKATDPRGAASGENCVIRGGSSLSNASTCGSAYRSNALPHWRGGEQGFRICLSPVSPPKTAEVFLLPEVGIAMFPIRNGTFTMGESLYGGAGDETQHEVTLTQDFWIGMTEVTQAQWKKVMGTTPREQVRKSWNSSAKCWVGKDGELVTMRRHYDERKLEISKLEEELKGDLEDDLDKNNLPMTWVSWHEAMEFCRRVTETERKAGRLPSGYEYTLPTEAQWEYACRAGTSGPYGGTGNLDEMGWYDKNSKWNLHPVAQKKSNDWGLYDMHGNVWEWCADWYGEYPKGKATDPNGASSGDARVMRGGGWNDTNCRSSLRGVRLPDSRNADRGFRISLRPVGK
ncbi:MAG: SUMF1/EgtB/PvdO family nonheme iron enzyme [Puniceicoccales bacterium]|jgi:formylglycine-generating enzyme required for sulfatase activity|nr:SUMF1/EgtB/PvdO family nonheme iron enzyme [Puniceicoccales bacterium]